MDLTVLKKRLSSFKTDGGHLTKVNDDLLVDILRAWESWTGDSKAFYRGLGLTRYQIGTFIKRGKKLSKSGNYGSGEFKELKLDSLVGPGGAMTGPIEVSWDQGKVIRFSQVEQLVDFLKKVA
jgi:hypothetical protein